MKMNPDRKHGIIYKTTNLTDGRIYVGYSANTRKRQSHYFGSNKELKSDLNRLGEETFIKIIIDNYRNKEERRRKERFWIAFYDARNPAIGYNVHPGGTGGDLSEQTRRKISKTLMGEGHPMFGKHLVEEQKQKISKTLSGIKRSNKTKRKISTARRGMTFSEKHRQNLSESHKGKIPWNKGMKMPFRSRKRRTA